MLAGWEAKCHLGVHGSKASGPGIRKDRCERESLLAHHKNDFLPANLVEEHGLLKALIKT